jgi:DNA-binding response OmpR family regulator
MTQVCEKNNFVCVMRAAFCCCGCSCGMKVASFMCAAYRARERNAVNKGFVILIAEGSARIRSYLMRELLAHGYGVVCAANHRELFALLDQGDCPAALTLLDWNLPFLGGREALALLRTRFPRIPVVAHSDISEYEHDSTVRQADAFVEKQGNPEPLLRALDAVLRRHYPDRFPEVSLVKNN